MQTQPDEMEATNILMDEHRVIERVLASLETAAHGLETGRPIDPEFFVEAAEFVRGFADGCHHRKEEGVLFPAVTSTGDAEGGAAVARLLDDHAEGRRLVGTMRTSAEALAAGDKTARARVVQSALGYVELLRGHITAEDDVVFPMAARLVDASSREDLTLAFDRVEHEETGEGVHERYLAMADRLAELAGA